MYYDLADRLIASVNVGTNGGSVWSRPGSVPSRSDTVLVNETSYDSAGRVFDETDPRGIVKRMSYDLLGRTVQTVEAYDGGAVTAHTNRTTRFAYDGANHLVLYTAIVDNSGTPVQVQQTAFIYGVTPSIGSSISSNDLLAATQFPNKTTGAPSSSEQEFYTYNALGNRTGFVDRNGTTHDYAFDVLGRPTADEATLAGGSDVDAAVLRLASAYDAQGNAALMTSYDVNGGDQVVNQVQRVFNGLGQLTREYQEHDGAVNTSTSRAVEYTYSEMASGANHSRPTSVVYPSGFTVSMTYTTTLDDAISRLHRLTDGSARLEEYSYLGLGTLIVRGHQEVGVDLTYIKLSGESNGDAGDKYIGLDRFGRVVDQRWLTGTAALDGFQYGYDRNSNRLWRDNAVNANFGELYHANGSSNGYDNLKQLTDFARGTLNSTHDTIVSPTRQQVWTLDPQGNFPTVVTNSATQTRTHNRQNELTGVDSAALSFDANGNMTMDELGNELTYDAWNRLVKVEDSSSAVLAEYAYDALTRRTFGYGLDLYYSQNWQMLEEFVTGQDAAVARYIWSIAYVDALVLREWFNGSSFDRMYVLQDANWNVTSIADTSAAVQERYIYDPYGLRTVLDASWNPLSASAYDWVYGHQGGRLDVDAGLYNFRYRDLSATLMRWFMVDPVLWQQLDSSDSLNRIDAADSYRYVRNNPSNETDPSGLGEAALPYGCPIPVSPLECAECQGACVCGAQGIYWMILQLGLQGVIENCCLLSCAKAVAGLIKPQAQPNAMTACVQSLLRFAFGPGVTCKCT